MKPGDLIVDNYGNVVILKQEDKSSFTCLDHPYTFHNAKLTTPFDLIKTTNISGSCSYDIQEFQTRIDKLDKKIKQAQRQINFIVQYKAMNVDCFRFHEAVYQVISSDHMMDIGELESIYKSLTPPTGEPKKLDLVKTSTGIFIVEAEPNYQTVKLYNHTNNHSFTQVQLIDTYPTSLHLNKIDDINLFITGCRQHINLRASIITEMKRLNLTHLNITEAKALCIVQSGFCENFNNIVNIIGG